MTELCLPPAHADCARCILLAHLPRGARVSVFGSRATGRGLKPHSGLDLLIDSPRELPLAAIAELREAFAESNLPFSVDLLQRRDASAEFLSRIETEGMVELNLLPAELPRTFTGSGISARRRPTLHATTQSTADLRKHDGKARDDTA